MGIKKIPMMEAKLRMDTTLMSGNLAPRGTKAICYSFNRLQPGYVQLVIPDGSSVAKISVPCDIVQFEVSIK